MLMNVAVLTSAEGAEMSSSSSDSVDAVVLCGWCLPQRLLMVLEGGFVKYALGMEGRKRRAGQLGTAGT